MTPSRIATAVAAAALVAGALALVLVLGGADRTDGDATVVPRLPEVSISSAPGFADRALPIVSHEEPGAAGQGAAAGGITVTGTAVAETAPDRSSWSFGVQAEGATAKEALDRASEGARSLVSALRREGVEERELRTEHVSVWPQYANGSRLSGYTASTSVHAVVVGLDRAGRVVDAAVDAGANNVSGPGLATGDRDRLYRQALAAAVEQARATAQALAREAGVELGEIVAIRESGGTAPPIVADRAVAAEAGAPMPIEAGRLHVSAAATVTFAIGG